MSEPTRERVRSTIGLVGGYWRPLAAVARLLEELGELAEVGGSDPRYASELADLWIITAALSDQFLGAVGEPDSHPPSGDDDGPVSRETGRGARNPLGSLVAAAGPIARIVNYYDGPKTPRGFDGWVSLSEAVAEFHRVLADVAHAHDIDLAETVNAKLDAIPALDSGRFGSGRHDPSTAASLERFRALHATSAQPDAVQPDAAGPCHDAAPADFDLARARLWGSPQWSSDDFASNLAPIVADLTSFTKVAPWERIDGYLISGPAVASTALLDEWLTRLLAAIVARDSADVHRTAPADARPAAAPADGAPDGPERRLTFNGLPLLVSVFSPPYGVSDSGRPTDTFLLLLRQ